MNQLLRIKVSYVEVYRHMLIYVGISYASLAVVYGGFCYYFITYKDVLVVIETITAIMMCTLPFLCISHQFQIIMYSMYLKFVLLNEFVQ